MTVTLCLYCSPDVGVYSIGAFPRAPSVWCGLPYHISSLTLWESAGNCSGSFPSAPSVGCGLPYHIWSLLSGILLATTLGVSEAPLGRVWPSLPHLVSTVWNSTGNCIGGFRGPPRSGVAFPTTSRL